MLLSALVRSLSSAQFSLIWILLSSRDPGADRVVITVDKLAELWNKDARTVRRVRRQLVDLGYLVYTDDEYEIFNIEAERTELSTHTDKVVHSEDVPENIYLYIYILWLQNQIKKQKTRKAKTIAKRKATIARKGDERYKSIYEACNTLFCFGKAETSEQQARRCTARADAIYKEFGHATGKTVEAFGAWWLSKKDRDGKSLALPGSVAGIINHITAFRAELESRPATTKFKDAIAIEFGEDND